MCVLITSKTIVGVNAIAMRDHFGGSGFWWENRGGVWLLVSTASVVYTYSVPILSTL